MSMMGRDCGRWLSAQSTPETALKAETIASCMQHLRRGLPCQMTVLGHGWGRYCIVWALDTPSAPKRPPETGMSMHADLLLLDDKAGETQRCKASV